MVKKLSIFVLLLMLLLSNGIHAQTDIPVFCGTLSEADCDILKQSHAVMQTVESFALDFKLDYDISSTLLPETIAFTMDGDAQLDLPFSALTSLQTPLDRDGTAETFLFTMDTWIEAISKMSGEIHIALSMPEEMGVGMSDVALDLLMVDGIVYVDTSMGLSAPNWVGFDLAGFYATFAGEILSQMDNMDLDAMMSTDLFDHFYEPEFQNRFRTVTRLADTQVGDQPVAVFAYTYNLAAIYSDEPFRSEVAAYLETLYDQQDLGMDGEQLAKAVLAIYDNINFEYGQWIGLSDGYMHRMDMEMSMNLDLDSLGALAGDMPMDQSLGAMEMDFDGIVKMSEFNEPVVVEAPEGAQIIDLFGNSSL